MIDGKQIAVVMPAYNAERAWKKLFAPCPASLTSRYSWTIQVTTTPHACQKSLVCRPLSTTRITAMDATSKPATARRSTRAPTSL